MKHRSSSACLFLTVMLLALFVVACGGPANPVPTENVRSNPPGSVSEGQKVFVAQGCGACHRVSSLPQATGTSAPNLSNFGGRTNMRIAENRDALARFLRDPQSDRPDATMPKFDKLTNDQLRDLVAYLASLKG